MLPNLENIKDRIKELIDSGDTHNLEEELRGLHCADLSEIYESLNKEERLICTNILSEDELADLLEELPPQMQVEILDDIDDEKAARIIMKMPHDSVADVLGDLDDVESETYLNKLPLRVSSQIRELLSYDEDTAGGIMDSAVITVNQDMTIEQVMSFLRVKAEKDNIELYYIYVVDKLNHLLGVVSLRNLLTCPLHIKIEDIMSTDIIKAYVDDPQDIVADILIKYGFLAVPIVDHYNRLKGMVTWDDAQEVTEEETTEEIYASSGITTDVIDEDEILSGHIYNAIRARTPWLFITLLGEMVAVNVAHHFDNLIGLLPIIAIFMPLLAGLGGNIGTQSITLMVRGLSTGEVNINAAMYHIVRELKIGFVIGTLFGILVTIFTWQWQHNYALGVVVGAAMITNMTLATVIGTLTPFALKKMKIDPAIASGPVIATTIDVMGLTVYFSMVTVAIKMFFLK
jgi:magnesium transporter